MRKNAILFVSVIFVFVNCYVTSFAKTENVESSIKHIVNTYFDGYFKSFVTLESSIPDNILVKNSNVLFDEMILESHLELYKLSNLRYINYNFNISYNDIIVEKNSALVSLLLDANYEYSNAPGMESGMYNINYNIGLTYKNGDWLINQINTTRKDFDHYKETFKQQKEKKLSQHTYLLDISTDIIDYQVVREVKSIKAKEMDFMFSPENNLIANKKDFKTVSSQYTTRASTFSYNVPRGISYAYRFAKKSSGDTSFFYTANSDCTNFVSQCVWASYGGYIEGNDTQTSSNVSNKVRMVNTGNVNTSWYAGSGGGTPYWESVESFWSYTTMSKSKGPNGTGDNNNGLYTNISPYSINLGDVLQFYKSSKGEYTHSVYVTYKISAPPGSGGGYENIYVSQHSDPYKNRNLTDLIWSFGNANCKMRRISFGSATFDN
ncbi:MAG: putative amidase domain protein [Firmicutes bacterium ADurb.Bin419]|nr:MAG: putative amidase domain protein [Firmicutes bacterium ADurb.Bin419]